MGLRILRGRIAMRELDAMHSDVLVLPDYINDWERKTSKSRGMRAQSSHRGVVLGYGDEALMYDRHPVPRGFEVGDTVVFVFALRGTEESRRGLWVDGRPCLWIAQEEVLAVIEAAA